MKKFVVIASACVAIAALGGCASTDPEVNPEVVQQYLKDKPQKLHDVFAPVMTQGKRNRVLNQLRAGLASMRSGHNELAAQVFDQALLTIDTVYGEDENAAAARSNFSAEDRKTFRGEPYERAMAFYYRGILYLMEDDYENARASFRSGVLQDALAEQTTYSDDFALLNFLEGWSSQCNGNESLASNAYAKAMGNNSKISLPEPGHNLLVLADLGYAPVKYTEGEHDELLKIRANSKKGVQQAQIVLAGRTEILGNTENILWQAQSRGGRKFDTILEGKAQFKEGAEDAAEVGEIVSDAGFGLATAGAIVGDQDLFGAGAATGVLGTIFEIASTEVAEATKPEADTRQWDTLPERVDYGTFRHDGPSNSLQVMASRLSAKHGGVGACKIAWISK